MVDVGVSVSVGGVVGVLDGTVVAVLVGVEVLVGVLDGAVVGVLVGVEVLVGVLVDVGGGSPHTPFTHTLGNKQHSPSAQMLAMGGRFPERLLVGQQSSSP